MTGQWRPFPDPPAIMMADYEMSGDRELLLQLIASLTLCEHMGDVVDAIRTVLRRLGVSLEWDDLDELGRELGAMGVTTLHGTKLGEEEEE